MTYFNYGVQFYQAKQNEKRNRRKQINYILCAHIYIRYIYIYTYIYNIQIFMKH